MKISIVQNQNKESSIRLPVHVTMLISSILTRGRFGFEDRANHHKIATPFFEVYRMTFCRKALRDR